MLTMLFTLTAIIVAWLIVKTAWRYHVTQLRIERDARNRNYHAAKLLLDQITYATNARDFYRAALEEIIRTTPLTDPSHQIAIRFLESQDGAGDAIA